MKQLYLRILRVDRDPGFKDTMRFDLEQSPQRAYIDTAKTVEQAFEKLEKNEYDAVISEYDLGDSDAIKLLKTVRKTSDIPFIIHSKYYSSLLEEKAEKNGVTMFLKKQDNNQYYLELLQQIARTVNREGDIEPGFRPDILCVYDWDGSHIKQNTAFLEATGRTSKEFPELRFWDIFQDTKEEEFREIMIETVSSGEVLTEGAVFTPTGLVNYDLKFTKIQERPRTLVGVLGTSREELTFYEPESRINAEAEVTPASELKS